MRYFTRRILAAATPVAAAAALGACRSATAPRGPVVVTLAAAPTSVLAGDTVHLLGIAYNPTADTVFAGYGCAPGIEFYAAAPAAPARSLYAGLAFTCEFKDSNALAPGETDSVAFAWHTPLAVGVFRFWAGLSSRDGLGSPSAALPITVR